MSGKLSSYQSLFGGKAPDLSNKGVDIIYLDPYSLKAPDGHVFKLYKGKRLDDLVNDIKENGIIQPLIIRRTDGGDYILSGNNRNNAAKIAGFKEVPCIIKEDISDEQARWLVISSNLYQRSFHDLSYSERIAVIYEVYEIAKVNNYVMRTFNSDDDEKEKQSASEIVSGVYDLSPRNVQRYYKLSNLIEKLLFLLDEGIINFTVAVDLAYLTEVQQGFVADILKEKQIKISTETSKELRKNRTGLEYDDIYKMLVKEKKKKDNKKTTKSKFYKLPMTIVEKFFDEDNQDDVDVVIEHALEEYFKTLNN